MHKLLIAAAMAGVTGVAIAQPPVAPPAPPAPPHHMMMQETQTRDQMVTRVRDHFARIDTNHDGVVAQDEMQAMRGMHRRLIAGGPHGAMQAGPIGDANAAFDRLDANRDGAITREEFAAARQIRIERRMVMRNGKPGGPLMGMRRGGGMRMLRMADGNGDGRITLAEAEAAALRHFDRMDANRDGRVTPEERANMRIKIRTERLKG